MTTRRRPTTPAPILPGFGPGPGGSPTASPAAPPCVREALEYFRSVHADPAAVPERPDPVKGPADVAAIAAILIAAAGAAGRGTEIVGMICLNAGNRITAARILSVGTVDQAPVYPREVARAAIETGATGVVLFHNHPGGQCAPSADDVTLTRRLSDALRVLDIQLLDHLILTAGEAYSIVYSTPVDLTA